MDDVEYECPNNHGNLRKNGRCPVCGSKAVIAPDWNTNFEVRHPKDAVQG
ncbi:MAG: hypothetical protein ABSF82_02785 [Candidatus Bathyarchaeia archaeon]